MANERKTENIVRKLLTKAGYYRNADIIVEEQKSDSPIIDKLLKIASKKGEGSGHPEFIIRSKTLSDFILVIECKADPKKHESQDLDKYAEYAVDGSLLYGSFLSKQYDVLAIAVSGQNMNELKISHHLLLKGENKHHPFLGKEILPFKDYYATYAKSEVKSNQDYNRLLEYTKQLNKILHRKKIKEAQRSLLISGILIALQNHSFKKGYRFHKKSEQLASHLLSTITDEFTNANLSSENITSLEQAFSFIHTDTTLTKDKEFFEALISDIDENVNNFIRTHKFFDALGQFYIEFLRYANNEKGLGIVLTPPHITDLFADLAEIDKNSVVYDNCCGTGGFLISAMEKMVQDAKGNSSKIARIKNKQLVGIEYQDDIYALGVSNMIVHGDGKTNIMRGDCFEHTSDIKKEFKPTVGLLNPPYGDGGGVEELDFVLNNLDTIQPGGKCVAIIPIGRAIALKGKDYERKQRILENHTLEAVMSMPEDLFHNSKVGVVTCAVVITAHKPHPKGKKTWLGYWRYDGFEKSKSKGRIDANNTWKDIKKKWLNNYFNKEVIRGQSLMKELTADKEWCIEAYLKTDYSKIDVDLYESFAQKYLAYRLLNNLLDLSIEVIFKPKVVVNKTVPLTEIFDVYNGLASSRVEVEEELITKNYVRYIRPSKTYTGSIAGYVDRAFIDSKYIYPKDTIYVSTDGQGSHTYSYVSSSDFVPNSNVSVLIPKKEMSLQEKIYYAICVTFNRRKFSYGRKPKGYRLEKLQLPSTPPVFVYDNIFRKVLNNWKKLVDSQEKKGDFTKREKS